MRKKNEREKGRKREVGALDTTGLIWEEEEDRQLGATYWRFKISIRCVVQVYSGTLFSKEKFVNILLSDPFK